MKDWEKCQKAVASMLRTYVRKYYAWTGAWGFALIDDAVAFGLCECWEIDELGLEPEQVKRATVQAAARFLSKEIRLARRHKDAVREGPDGESYSLMDYWATTPATQEEHCDAAKVARLVGSSEMLEMIAYGDKKDGGLARIRAERRVREALGTFKPLTVRWAAK